MDNNTFTMIQFLHQVNALKRFSKWGGGGGQVARSELSVGVGSTGSKGWTPKAQGF